ncbi:hypothetical protein DIZ81_02125 [Legionella taurinensis]|uniref:Uncharacterized protein n=1 Tax=Legionella taurinensis TaxID=70611 RepID=A0A3A5L2Y3_9GAMM|nr:hypothetical protein [Legionella taurinensis]MDX1836332.1 hypothetical protein [Legionella taurinensis]PUT41917.1 hypothetical protein DB744_02130 [Legionella taurinensis]PUT44706.1 hypothetical protein DB746_02130 [Legionella taurinensis]PUT48026.1 hypothetical protein DB743_00290 [Legionella taurinensis]PUT48840.1 hypothetical protein DB745_02130 [Legionella taurinensis]
MDRVREEDLLRIKELLRHASEFIAYFELAEIKMMEWRQDIELQTQLQQQQTQEQLQSLRKELENFHEVLTQAGLQRLRQQTEQTLKQGESHLHSLQKTSQQMLADMQSQHREFTKTVEKSLAQLDDYALTAIQKIGTLLADYDVQHFKRVANESCEYVEKAASQAIAQSTRLLRTFQWRAAAFACLTTLLTAFGVGLYVNNEMPWEMHQQARNEREAGKLLMRAWPMLSQQEKDNIVAGGKRNKS